MASSIISNPITNTDRSRDSMRKKKKKKKKNKAHTKHQQEDPSQRHPKWKSQAQQQIYSNKLRQALTSVNLGSAPCRGKAVREAADRALTVTAKGRTRWSRAILMSRLKLKFRKHKTQRITAATVAATRSKKPRVSILRLKGKAVPSVQRKVRFHGRLVPGCKKEPLPVILEEAIDREGCLNLLSPPIEAFLLFSTHCVSFFLSLFRVYVSFVCKWRWRGCH